MKFLFVAALIPLLLITPILSYEATSGVRSCDDSKSCVVTFKNGTQWVQLSNAKWKCIDNIMKGVIEGSTPGFTGLAQATASIGIAICLKTS